MAIINIAHETLIRHWPRLREWVNEDREFKVWQDHILRPAEKKWLENNKKGWLLHDEQLVEAQVWLKKRSYKLNDNQKEFIEASITRKKKSQQRIILSLITIIIIISCLAIWIFWERNNALKTEQKRTESLFESQLTQASLLVWNDDYITAKQLLNDSRQLDSQISISRRHARDLLAGFADIMGGTAAQVYKGANAKLYTVAVSSDGQLLATAGEMGTLLLFDVNTAQLIKRLEGHDKTAGEFGAIYDVIFHPQNKWLASAGEDKRIIFWSLPQGNKLFEWQLSSEVNALAISIDGMQLAAGTGNEIILWSLENGEKQRTFLGHEKPISNEGLAFSFNGEKLASVSYDNTARLWDVKTGKKLRTFEESFPNTIAFSPDDKLLAINSDENIHLWDIASGKLLHTLREHQNEVIGLSFVADGRYVVSAGYDRLIRIWDAKSEDVTVRVLQGHKAAITGLTTYKRQLFTASNDGTVQRWETNLPSQKIVDLSGHPESVAINPNGNNIAVGFKDGTLRLYSHPETYLLTEYEKAHTNAIIHIAFNVSGNLLASASVDNTAKLWKIKRKLGKISLQEKISFKHKDIVQAVAFSPDNQTLATASYDGQIGLLTLNTNQKRFFQAHEKCDKYGCVKSVAFNNSGTHLLSSGYNERVTRLWNLNTEPPTLSRTFPEALDKLLWASISPDNQKIASVGDDLLVHIYTNQNDQEQYFSLVGHENPITRVIFSPDSQQVATISLDTTIRLWDLKSRRELFILYLPMTPADTGPWDFDFLCLSNKHCWIAVPLTTKKSLKLYDLGKYE